MKLETFDTISTWATRTMIGILLYLGMEMRADIKTVKEIIPALQQQVIDLKERNARMENKIYAGFIKLPAKKEDEINFDNLIKLK